jgi:CheY-like chemotaxis protein
MTKRVLVVDDEVVIADAIAAVLQDEGYDVVVAANGQEGLARARESRPDVILADVMMPVMDGEEMVRCLRAEGATSTVPVVVMSAVYQSREQLPFGHFAFLAKPFDLDTLLDTIARALGSMQPDVIRFVQSEEEFERGLGVELRQTSWEFSITGDEAKQERLRQLMLEHRTHYADRVASSRSARGDEAAQPGAMSC